MTPPCIPLGTNYKSGRSHRKSRLVHTRRGLNQIPKTTSAGRASIPFKPSRYRLSLAVDVLLFTIIDIYTTWDTKVKLKALKCGLTYSIYTQKWEKAPSPPPQHTHMVCTSYSCGSRLRVAVGSTLTPGPIVLESVTDLMYLPLAVAGLIRTISAISAA